MNIYLILSLLPFLIIVYFLLFKEKKTYIVMAGTYLFTATILLIFWKMSSLVILTATFKGILIGLEIFLIIISILMLIDLMQKRGSIKIIENFLKKYTADKNVLIILIGWYLVIFFEGIAGFGTPVAIAVPILVFLGIKPFQAIIVCLISNSCVATFGAFGTPIIMGIAKSVENVNLAQVSFYVGIFVSIISLFTPLLILLVYNFLEHKSIKSVKKYVSFALASGFFFSISVLFSSYYLGPKICLVFSSVAGLLATLFLLNSGILIKINKEKITNKLQIFFGFIPYFVLVLLFLISKIEFFHLTKISPGFFILTVFLLFSAIYKIKLKEFENIVKLSFEKSKFVLITLIATLAFVQLTIFSNINSLNIPSIPFLIASLFSNTGLLYLPISIFLGAFGSFISGSVTVSNLIFANLQVSVASLNEIPSSLILANQSIGGSIGNMVAIHNVIIALAVVNLKHKDHKIIKFNLIFVLLYLLVISIVAYGLLFLFF